MIELNEWDISTSFDNGFINQYLKVINIGTYYAEPANSIEDAVNSRKKLFNHIIEDLKGKHEVKINLSK